MMNFHNSKRNRIIAAAIVILMVLAMVVTTILGALFLKTGSERRTATAKAAADGETDEKIQ